MTLTLDPHSEELIQRELALGRYSGAAEVIAHALTLLESEKQWSDEEKAALNAHLTQSLAQVERGETYSPDEAREYLARKRALRAG